VFRRQFARRNIEKEVSMKNSCSVSLSHNNLALIHSPPIMHFTPISLQQIVLLLGIHCESDYEPEVQVVVPIAAQTG